MNASTPQTRRPATGAVRRNSDAASSPSHATQPESEVAVIEPAPAAVSAEAGSTSESQRRNPTTEEDGASQAPDAAGPDLLSVANVDPSLTDKLAQTLRAEIAELNRRIAGYDARRQQQKDTAEAFNEEIKLTDWVLTGRQVVGRRYDDDKALRTSLFKRLHAADAEIKAIDEQAAPLKIERDRLTINLTDRIDKLRPPLTVEVVQLEIDQLDDDVVSLRGDVPEIAESLSADLKTLAEVEAALAAEKVASQQLETLRGQAFLAKGDARPAAEQRVIDADLALTIAREKAAGARAARPHVEESVSERRAELAGLNATIQDKLQRIESKKELQRNIAAWTAWDNAVDSLRSAVRGVLDADRDQGRKLLEALRYEGLRVFDKRGFIVRPAWLELGVARID